MNAATAARFSAMAVSISVMAAHGSTAAASHTLRAGRRGRELDVADHAAASLQEPLRERLGNIAMAVGPPAPKRKQASAGNRDDPQRLHRRRRRAEDVGDVNQQQRDDQDAEGPLPDPVARMGDPGIDRHAGKTHRNFDGERGRDRVPEAEPELRTTGKEWHVRAMYHYDEDPVTDH